MTPRGLAAEALGTCLLVTAVIGSAIMAGNLTQDHGVQLLANAIATGAALLVLITVLAPISGAHFNPAVSLILALRRDITWPTCAAFTLAQCTGGIAGTVLAHAMFDLSLWQTASHIRTGPSQYLAEGIATFGLILTILGGQQARANVAALVASYIVAAYWFTSSTSFANPVMTLARSLTDTPSGIRPSDAPVFVMAEIAGAVVASALCAWLFPRPDQA